MSLDVLRVQPALRARLLRLGAKVEQAVAAARIPPASGEANAAQYFAFWEALGASERA